MDNLASEMARHHINSLYGINAEKPTYRGYELDKLVACCMLLEKEGITPEKLNEAFDMYAQGYIDGQKYRIEENKMIIGKWLDGWNMKFDFEPPKEKE
ncbi:MAG: hypothetical protein MJ126_05835 [Lachnospiraceae bacterium]|nr:hypothetical protein [Lachnospiraceae bacterium]